MIQLQLEIISKHRYLLMDNAHFVFDQQGGTIGRDQACTWVLQEANNFISSTHLRLEYHSNAFYITDLSTNGTFRNQERLAHGQQDSQPLRQDEELVLGDVRVKVVTLQTPALEAKTQVIHPPVDQNLDTAQLLAQQSHLADVIAQSHPDIDHGPFMSGLQGAQPQPPLAEPLLETMVKALFIETQQRLAIDRIENPGQYATMSIDNIFRQGACLQDFYHLAQSPDAVQQDLQEILRYIASRQ